MDMNNSISVGNSIGSTVDNLWWWPNGTMPYQPTYYCWPAYQTVEKEVEPKSCMGKAHVFECDHVAACQCGKIKRVMPRAKAK